MVAFLVQFSSQHKPVPTNQPLSTFGHLHLSKATNSRNNPIPANAVEAKKQVGPPCPPSLLVMSAPSSGLEFSSAGEVFLNQFIGSKSIDLDFVFFVFNCEQRCRNWSLKVRWTKILNLPSTTTHDLGDGYSLWHTHCQVDDFLLKIDWRCNLIFFLHETESHSFEYSIDVKFMYTCLWVQFLLFTSS